MRIIPTIITTFILGTATLLGGIFFLAHHPWVDLRVLEQYKADKPSILLDDEGIEWARFQLDRREPIPLRQVPIHVIEAFLAAEDRHFYTHGGISWRGIIRSLWANIYHRRLAQGASTITQQLVKLLFFDTKKTLSRKIKEQLLALIAEQQFTKDQILEAYINHIYFGCGIYGIQAAAQRFWSKDVSELSVAQAATLAGIIRSPAHYCPLEHPREAYSRRQVVLSCMLKAGFIDQKVYESACQETFVLMNQSSSQIAPHFKEMIRQELEATVGKQALYQEGLVIQTTLNRAMQQRAEYEMDRHLTLMRTNVPEAEGALVSIDRTTGAIKALVGGRDYKRSQFNRAKARRQMGSIFKPILYAIALEQGRSFADVMVDEPISLMMHDGTLWEPRNSQKRFDGPMTLARALIQSNNMIPIQLLLELGIETVITRAAAYHINGTLEPYPALALGCIDVKPLDVVSMFNIWVNGGMYVKPYSVASIKDGSGKKIMKHVHAHEQVASMAISSKITKVLACSINHWKSLIDTPFPSCDIMGKTGTTNDARTCWFVGSTPTFTTAIYVGSDDNRPMGSDVYAVKTALPIWLSFNRTIVQPVKHFSYDPRLTEIVINDTTGARTSAADPRAVTLLSEAA